MDVFVINREFGNNFLMQACSQTKGMYLIAPENNKTVVEFFVNSFGSLTEIREKFKCPHLNKISNSSLCHCCNKTINFGFACSNCLKVSCERPKPIDFKCRFCQIRFDPFSAKELSKFD